MGARQFACPGPRRPATRRVSGIFLGFLLFAAATPALAVIVNRIVATVDGEPITLYQLEIYLRQNAGGATLGGLTTEEREKVLRALIDDTLIRKESRALGIGVSKQEIDAYIDQIKKQNNLDDQRLAEALAAQGLSMEAYNEQIAKEMLKQQVISKQIREKVSISDEQIQGWYDENKTQFAKPSAVELDQLWFMPTKEMSQAELEAMVEGAKEGFMRLQKGDKPSVVATDLAARGIPVEAVDLGWIRPGQMLPELEQVAFALHKGQVAPPVQSPAGLHILVVRDVEAASYTPLAEVRDQIRDRLYALEVQSRFESWAEKELREGHAIDIRPSPPPAQV